MMKRKKIFNLILIIALLITHQRSFAQLKDIQIANNYALHEEYEKAYDIFKKLEKKKNIPYIHKNYFKLLFTMNKFDEAEVYINKVIGWYKENVSYWVDKGIIYYTLGDKRKIDDYFNRLIKKSKKNKLSVLASHLFSKRLFKYALVAYLVCEKTATKNNISNVLLQIASLYAITNQKKLMIMKYLDYLERNPHSISYIQNIMQIYLKDEKERQLLRETLYEKVQKNANIFFYRELLVWLEIQEKNFKRAFIQAKSLDKLSNSQGYRVDQVAKIAYQNKDFDSSLEMYQYLVSNFPNSSNYYHYKKDLIKTKEQILKSDRFNINSEKIEELISDYEEIIQNSSKPQVKTEAKKNQASLFAFYLNSYENAIDILEKLLKKNTLGSRNKAEVKMLLADIYLLSGNMWEPALLYFQVEKDNKETRIGHLARLKNAELSFYRGDFELAKNQLNILKLATSRKIANDALELSILIDENIKDRQALSTYANIKLLFLQNKNNQALDSLNTKISESKHFSIGDKMLLLRANYYIDKKEYDQANTDLDKIIEHYSYGLLVDDALFLKGKIYEDFINIKAKAMKNYELLIKKYPGSFFVNKARKRYRKLRGDYL